MISFPREVRAGDRISATEFNEVVRLLRRLYPLQGPGIKLSSGPNGTVFSADMAASTPLSVNAVTGAGCYELIEVEETQNGETVINKYLANQYYVDGAVLKSTNFTDPLDPETHYEKILAVRVPMTASGSATLQAYETYDDMHAASLNRAYVILPLYQLDENGGIVCDFRNAPRVQAVEVLS